MRGNVPPRIAARLPDILTKVFFNDFPRSVPANAEIVPRTRYKRILTKS